MSVLLHIETSTEVCSVALSRDGDLLAYIDHAIGMMHGELLAVYIDQLMQDQGLATKELSGVAVSIGPGSYTGLRIGLSTAKGLCYAIRKPLIALPTLETLCRATLSEYDAAHHLALMDARRMEVYAVLMDPDGKIVWGPTAWILDDEAGGPDGQRLQGRVVVSGNATQKLRSQFGDKVWIDSGLRCAARHMVPMAHKAFAEGDFADLAYCEPFYLKEARVTTSIKHQLFGLG
jgi:tRNA threonylcarbamoyladenosine biosynthesis protein TsaB